MGKFSVEMNFCRRCGSKLEHKGGPVYACQQNHTIFLVAPPAVGLILLNAKNEILVLERGIEPGKGLLDVPGGFCDGPESLEDAVARETEEEVRLKPTDYAKPEYVLSGVDEYGYGGEILPVQSVVFVANMSAKTQPVAGDDAVTAYWVSAAELDLDKVCFPVVREAIERVIGGL